MFTKTVTIFDIQCHTHSTNYKHDHNWTKNHCWPNVIKT